MLLDKIKEFTSTLDKSDFYDFYSLMTAMAGPKVGDYIIVGTNTYNLKKITRKIRITVMSPRFDVDYANAYTKETALQDYELLRDLIPCVRGEERDSVTKLYFALGTIIDNL